ncbi:MAG: GGDEF domain-containing protein [Bacilli bacterium]|nr:GGDEF domain-containing protein [Bacilli bacterium]
MQVLKSIAGLFGIRKHSKYVRRYLAEANVRNSIFMAAVIIVLEIWLVCRQFDKYLIPGWSNGSLQPGFEAVFSYTSNFWLFFFVGCSVFVYSLTYIYKKIPPKVALWLNLVVSTITFGYGFFVFHEPYKAWDTTSHILSNVLLISIYVWALILAALIIVDTFLAHFKKIHLPIILILILVCFAAMCFSFGVKVSYSDYTSKNHKEILCFLTMVLFGSSLVIWRPYISIILNLVLFHVFYFLIRDAQVVVPEVAFKDGDLVNYITFVVALTVVCIAIYHQRYGEAIREEELQFIADYDEMTKLHNESYLIRSLSGKALEKNNMLCFLNVADFKSYNDFRGFDKGSECLVRIGKILVEEYGEEHVARVSDDHFLVYEPNYQEGHFEDVQKKIAALDQEMPPIVKMGGYPLKEGDDIRRCVDKARYACSVVTLDALREYVIYDSVMDEAYRLMRHVVHRIDQACEEGWVRPYYQPVVWAKDGKLCGTEALARWVDPAYGFLNPGNFVPVLERTKLIYKLDAAILEGVCRDMRDAFDAGLSVVPVSINFSRLDFESMNVPELLEKTLQKYNIPKEYVHVEITESALTEEDGLLRRNATLLKEMGYALWLDDFGSGYSSLNVLKDFQFDVMKIDMAFLKGFETNPKAKILLKTVVELASRLGMRTLTEGVETQEAVKFLKEAGCERFQGYYFSKPISKEDLRKKIDSGEFFVSDKLL